MRRQFKMIEAGGGGASDTAWATISSSGKDDMFQTVELFDSAKPLDFIDSTCGDANGSGSGLGSGGQNVFKEMDFTLCTSRGSSKVLVPAGYAAGVAGLQRWKDCNPGSGSGGGGGSGQEWDGWVVVFGRRQRCLFEWPTKVECCPIEGLKFTEFEQSLLFGVKIGTRLDPCAPSGSGSG